MARGRLIVANGGDDVSLPSRVQDIHEAWMFHGKPGAIQSEWIDIDESGKELEVSRPSVRRPQGNVLKWTDPKFLDQIESQFFFHYVGAALTYDRTAVYDEFSELDAELFNEDQVLPFRASLKEGVLYLPKALVKYRQHSKNLTNLHRRRFASPNTTLSEQQLVMRDLRIRRLMRYQAHVRDLECCLKIGEIDVSAEALKKAIADKAEIVQLLIDWWDMSFAQRLKAFAAIYRRGAPQDRRWAAKRILPWRIYEFLATKPWRRTNLPHPR
jgi:hypothetical protein